ncbi:MAG TPA: HEAT repeat domain-containing protein, partial [Planctomycetota bacterium]|nr:HEAT repeat domain-containing protein [Planctomycetota bacterium]
LALTLPLLLWRQALVASLARDVPRLGSADDGVRGAAQARMERLAPDAVPVLIASFAEAADAWDPGKPPAGTVPGEATLTGPVMTSLHTLGGQAVIAALIGALGDEDSNVRHSSALTLAWLGAEAMPALVETLRHADDARRRVSAAWITSFLGPAGRDALPALRAALADADKDLRYTARYAIAEIESSDETRAKVIDATRTRDEGR